MNTSKLRKLVFTLFLGLGLFVAATVTLRSQSRSSLFEEPVGEEKQEQGERVPTLRLRDFNRVELRDGKISWEVDGEDAKYYDKEQSATLSNPTIKVFRDDGSKITIVASLARLKFEAQDLSEVEAEGNVVVSTPDGREVRTQLVAYNRSTGLLEAEGEVTILAPGLIIEGRGMKSDMNKEITVVEQNVLTRIERNAELSVLEQ